MEEEYVVSRRNLAKILVITYYINIYISHFILRKAIIILKYSKYHFKTVSS